jgi:hypothetical protein
MGLQVKWTNIQIDVCNAGKREKLEKMCHGVNLFLKMPIYSNADTWTESLSEPQLHS